MRYILAGDVGGTKSVLCLYRIAEPGAPQVELNKAVFASGQFATFDQVLEAFMREIAPLRPELACLGVAGPVTGERGQQRCQATNLPWVLDAAQLAQQFQFSDLLLLNDLEAAAYGMLCLGDDEWVELNPQAQIEPGHKAVIAAGTGLGEAILPWNGHDYFAMPTEGGHTDFGTNNPQEDALLVFLRERFGGHVSVERILAGDGFGNLYDFLRSTGFASPDPELEARMQTGDRNALISEQGLEGSDALCSEVMRLFVQIYGREAGDLALKCLPRGGLYIAGGIGPKIRPALESGGFMQGFLDKGRMAQAIRYIPVRLALNPEAPLLGAAFQAQQLLQP